MRKIPSILIASILTFGSAVSASAEPVSLRVGYAFAYRDAAWREQVANEFMRIHPDIKIKLESNATDCPTLLQQTLRSAITNDLPDVIASVCYPDMQVLADRGVAVPIDTFISNDKSWSEVGLTPAAMNTVKWKGSVIALPENISSLIVYFNMALVQKADPVLKELPTTWDGILQLANNVGSRDKDSMPIFMEYYPDSYNWSFNGLIYNFGGDVFDKNGKIAFDSAAGKQALEILQRLGKAGMTDITSEQARQSFVAGKIAIYVASSSLLNIFTKGAANNFDMRTEQYPHSAPDGKLPSGGGGFVMATKDADKQRAAWEFMKFAVGPEAQTVMVTKAGFTPVNSTAISSAQFLGDFYKAKPNYIVAVDELPRIKPMNIYPGENGPKITTVIRDYLQSVVTLKRTPEEVMPEMVRDVSRLLPKK
ncbi:extracellular solute-binding protein [Labrys okinawensis]|uniref:extracellular solute-binding protein n=1 Tax=Labrys okinawensis TaxID=346911 RepID=UPI0039BCA60D